MKRPTKKQIIEKIQEREEELNERANYWFEESKRKPNNALYEQLWNINAERVMELRRLKDFINGEEVF